MMTATQKAIAQSKLQMLQIAKNRFVYGPITRK